MVKQRTVLSLSRRRDRLCGKTLRAIDYRRWTEDDDRADNENGRYFVSCDYFFGSMWNERPTYTDKRPYKKLSQQGGLLWCSDGALMQYLTSAAGAEILRGVQSGGDRAALLKKLHGSKGDKRSRISHWNGIKK